MNTLYFEASVCHDTGAAGWGAVLLIGDALQQAAGGVCAPDGLSPTCATLTAARDAFQGMMLGRRAQGIEIAMATRSTAAIAVLRWAFPEAPHDGVIIVQRPKKLKADVRDFQPLYDLEEDVERSGVRLRLTLVGPSTNTELAARIARQEMEIARRHIQRRA